MEGKKTLEQGVKYGMDPTERAEKEAFIKKLEANLEKAKQGNEEPPASIKKKQRKEETPASAKSDEATEIAKKPASKWDSINAAHDGTTAAPNLRSQWLKCISAEGGDMSAAAIKWRQVVTCIYLHGRRSMINFT